MGPPILLLVCQGQSEEARATMVHAGPGGLWTVLGLRVAVSSRVYMY